MKENGRAEKKPRLSRQAREEKARKWTSVVLIVLFCALIAAAILTIHQADLRRAVEIPPAAQKSPITANRKRDYGEAGFQLVAENELLILKADYTNGEICVEQKSTGKIWYSNPPERTQSGIKGVKGRMSSQLILTYCNVNTADPSTADNLTQSINQGGMEHELIENGVKFTFAFPTAGIIVPIQYTLNGDALEVTIPTDEIQELWSERYIATSLDVLPFFGASLQTAQGYMMVPDGSGALIELSSSNYTMNQFMSPVYGHDATLEYDLTTQNKKTVALPVFGMKWDDDGYVAVITEGESNARIYSYLSQKVTSFNQLYAQMVMRTVKMKQVGGMGENYGAMVAKSGDEKMEDWSDFLYRGTDFSVSYFFLEPEQASYTGMSSRYQQYLESRQQKTASEMPMEQYLVLDVYGAVSIEKYIMGIKTPIITPLTTYNQVCSLVDELRSRGVEHLIINYVGALKGGLQRDMMDEVRHEPALGTEAEFEHMIAYLDELGVLLFLEAEPVNLYEDGSGYLKSFHCTKSYFDSLTTTVKWAPNRTTEKVAVGKTAYFLKPKNVLSFMESFAASADQQGVKGISVSNLGSILYSDLSRTGEDTTRAETRALWQQIMADSKTHADYLMVHQGNAYCLPYADVITDVPVGHSDFDCLGISVPFYSLSLHGDIVMATEAINDSADYQFMTLKAIESGISLKYNVMAADAKTLVGTIYNDMVSYSLDHWLDTIVESYHQVQSVTGDLAGEKIVDHREVAPGVMETTYASGAKVYVNYAEEPVDYQGMTIGARDCLLVRGDE